VQRLRLRAGELMGLGDVTHASVPKTTLVSAPRDGGTVSTRTFIPLRVHESIGVLGAVTVATAMLLDGAVGREHAALPAPGEPIGVEHPAGRLDVLVEVEGGAVRRAGVVRTARKLFDGTVFPRPATSPPPATS
jgi:4-oxalomesaconate tautomerase